MCFLLPTLFIWRKMHRFVHMDLFIFAKSFCYWHENDAIIFVAPWVNTFVSLWISRVLQILFVRILLQHFHTTFLVVGNGWFWSLYWWYLGYCLSGSWIRIQFHPFTASTALLVLCVCLVCTLHMHSSRKGLTVAHKHTVVTQQTQQLVCQNECKMSVNGQNKI